MKSDILPRLVSDLDRRVTALEKKVKKMLASKHGKKYTSGVDSIQKQGGKARADKLTAEQRKAIAQKAAAARWKNRGNAGVTQDDPNGTK